MARCSGNSNPEGLVSFNGEIDVFNPNALGQYIQCLAKLGECKNSAACSHNAIVIGFAGLYDYLKIQPSN